ncbi:MAG: hypothetical protein IJV71_03700 [Lachnospiraceae bacterium]|nr:hypothetical protein [Lachnospiraceae bacterium]
MNFKDEYQKELEYYNPEASAERLRKIKLKERRMEDIKAIPYFIIAFLILGFAWWLLCTERTEKISNTYHGYIFQKSENVVDDKFKEPLTLTIEGELTYASKVSKRLTAIDVTITLKDTDGNVVFRNSNYVNCDFPQDGLTGYQLAEYTDEDGLSITYTGLIYFTEDFKEIALYVKEGELWYAAPASTAEDARDLYLGMFGVE